ncbi:MAG TPA: extracellular solute-binding protein [Thermomicrobiales bacterium]|nr:extracellular solute-binding protein [Thermomicrobiales bacterium]
MSILTAQANRRLVAKLAALGATVTGISLTASSAATAQDSPTVVYWLDVTGGSDTAQWVIDNTVAEFNALGGVQVEATMQPNGWTATQTALAGGAGPDVVVTPGPSLSMELGKAGQVMALDDYATEFGWADSFAPWAMDLGRVNDALIALPNEVETLVLYYNKTLFEAQGWTPPTTIDEMTALAQQVADADIIPFAHTNAEWKGSNEWFVGEFLNHAAGPDLVYQALTGEIPWTDQAFADALTILNDYQQNGWFMGGLDRYYTTPSADATAALAYGDAAMKIEGSWLISDANTFFEESGQEWEWVPMPSTSGEAIFDLGIGSTYSINANSEVPDAAAEFLNYLFSPEVQAKAVTGIGLAAAPVTIPEDLLGDLDPRQARMIEELNAASSAGGYGYTTWTFWPPKSETYLIEDIERVWAGDLTVEEYLQGLQDIFVTELDAGDVPPVPAR